MKKIITIDNLTEKLKILKQKKQKIGLCHGVFDLIHIGHLRHFN
jgi:bifunctional ADP-heptose synthase (sugar kinase/adenylyltransferase)